MWGKSRGSAWKEGRQTKVDTETDSCHNQPPTRGFDAQVDFVCPPPSKKMIRLRVMSDAVRISNVGEESRVEAEQSREIRQCR